MFALQLIPTQNYDPGPMRFPRDVEEELIDLQDKDMDQYPVFWNGPDEFYDNGYTLYSETYDDGVMQ